MESRELVRRALHHCGVNMSWVPEATTPTAVCAHLTVCLGCCRAVNRAKGGLTAYFSQLLRVIFVVEVDQV